MNQPCSGEVGPKRSVRVSEERDKSESSARDAKELSSIAKVENRAMAAKESRHKVTGRLSVDRSYRESERVNASKKWTGAVPGVQPRR
jgi:hypothetical protein